MLSGVYAGIIFLRIYRATPGIPSGLTILLDSICWGSFRVIPIDGKAALCFPLFAKHVYTPCVPDFGFAMRFCGRFCKRPQGLGAVAEQSLRAGDLVYEEAPLIIWNIEENEMLRFVKKVGKLKRRVEPFTLFFKFWVIWQDGRQRQLLKLGVSWTSLSQDESNFPVLTNICCSLPGGGRVACLSVPFDFTQSRPAKICIICYVLELRDPWMFENHYSFLFPPAGLLTVAFLPLPLATAAAFWRPSWAECRWPFMSKMWINYQLISHLNVAQAQRTLNTRWARRSVEAAVKRPAGSAQRPWRPAKKRLNSSLQTA